MHAKLSTLCSCWDSDLQVASCQQLTSQHQLPVVSFCCRATPQTCQMCLKLQCLYLTSCGKSFETLDRCAFAAKAMAIGEVAECAASHTAWAEDTSDFAANGILSWCLFGAEEATLPPFRASVSQGESADNSGLCSSDCDSECGYKIAQGKTCTALGSISKPWCARRYFAHYQLQSDRTCE